MIVTLVSMLNKQDFFSSYVFCLGFLLCFLFQTKAGWQCCRSNIDSSLKVKTDQNFFVSFLFMFVLNIIKSKNPFYLQPKHKSIRFVLNLIDLWNSVSYDILNLCVIPIFQNLSWASRLRRPVYCLFIIDLLYSTPFFVLEKYTNLLCDSLWRLGDSYCLSMQHAQ